MAWMVSSAVPSMTIRAEKNVPDAIYEQEADAFLASRPDGISDRQTRAIKRAVGGYIQDLEDVRRSRAGDAANRDERLVVSDTVIITRQGRSLRLRKVAPSGVSPRSAMLYLHGGGWTFGSPSSCSEICDSIALLGGTTVVPPGYRLAPENPYPAPLEDVVAALEYTSSIARHVVIGGDSSGGNLAIAASLAVNPDCRPDAVAAIYPVCEAVECPDDPSWREYAKSYGQDADQMAVFNSAYTASSDSVARLPLVSPGFAPESMLRDLPPVVIISAGRDILLDQSTRFAARLRKAGVPVEHTVIPGAVHLFATVPGQPAARRRAIGIILPLLGDSESGN